MTYYPGWSFRLTEEYEGLHLHIRAELENSYRPGTTTTLNIVSPLPPMRDEAAVGEWLLWRLSRIAVHETAEWLRIGGQLVRDPHAEIPKT